MANAAGAAICAAGAAMQQHYGASASSGNADAINGVCTTANLFNEAEASTIGTCQIFLINLLTNAFIVANNFYPFHKFFFQFSQIFESITALNYSVYSLLILISCFAFFLFFSSNFTIFIHSRIQKQTERERRVRP